MEFENKKLRSVAEAAARIMMGEKALHPNQQKLDVHEPEKDKLTSHDFKKLRTMKKEEIEDVSEMDYGGGKNPNAGHGLSHDDDDDGKKELTAKVSKGGNVVKSALDILNKQSVNKKDLKKEEVDLDEGKMAQLDADLKDLSHADFHKEYGKPKSHYDPSNFKKPVQKGKEMDRAKSLAQRGMASMKKEEVEDLSEATYVVKHDGVADDHADADAKKLFAGKTNVNSHVSKYASSAEKHADMLKSKGFKNVRIQTMNKEEVGHEEDLEEGIFNGIKNSFYGALIKKAKEKIPAEHHKDYDFESMRSMDGTNKLLAKAKAAGHFKSKFSKEEVEKIEEMFPGTPEYEKKYGKAPQDMKPGEKKKTTKGEMEKTEKGVVHKRKFSEMVESYTEGGVKGLFKTLAEEPTSAEFDAQLDDAKKRAAGTKKQPEVSKPAVQAVQNEEFELTLEDFTPEELEDFMQTEEYEQLDELSKATLGSYVKKASKDLVGLTRMNTELDTWKKNDDGYKKYAHKDPKIRQPRIVSPFPPSAKKLLDKSTLKTKNRTAGIGKAVDRMTKEDVESFEEQTHTTVSFIDYNDVNGVKYAEIDLSKKN